MKPPPSRACPSTVLILCFLCIFLPSGVQSTEEELSEYVVSECYGDIFNFDCGRGNKIRINKDFFGYSKAKTCRYSKGECIISNPKSNSLIHRFCTGHRVCTYYLVERRGCGGSFSNYQQVEYQCIPDTIVTDICSVVDYKATSTYIASPNFPENYPPKLNCRCVVSAITPKAKVRMEIVYLAIKYTSPCRDWLSIGMRRTCGTTMDLFQGRRIPIEFRSNAEDSHSGFWLHFKSSIPGDQIHIQCGNVTLRPPRPDVQRHKTSTPPDQVKAPGGDHENEDDDDVIERSPRPEDIPEERTSTLRMPPPVSENPLNTNGKSITDKNASLDTANQHTQDDPGEQPARTTSADPLGIAELTTTITHTSGLPDVKPGDEEDILWEGVTQDALEEGDDTNNDNPADAKPYGKGKIETNHPGVLEGVTPINYPNSTQRSRDIFYQNNIINHKSNSISISTESPSKDKEHSLDDDILVHGEKSSPGDADRLEESTGPADFASTTSISRLDDESWLVSPPAGNGATVDDDSWSNRKRNQSSEPMGNGQKKDESEGGSKSPITTKTPRLPTLVPSIATARKPDNFLTLGVIIISVSISVGVLLVCIVLLVVFLRRHRTRDEETQTPRGAAGVPGSGASSKTVGSGSDGDSGQGLLPVPSRHHGIKCSVADKSLQIDLDSDVDVVVLPFGHHHLHHNQSSNTIDTDAFSISSSVVSNPYVNSSGNTDPNCKGVQVTANALAKANFPFPKHNRKLGRSSLETFRQTGSQDGSSCGASEHGSFSGCSDLNNENDDSSSGGLGHHRTSLASMSLYSEVTLVPENAVLSNDNDFYDSSFSDPDWDKKSAISI